MNPLNLQLEVLFHKQAEKTEAASLYRKADGDVLRICKTCILRGPMFESEQLPMEKLVEYKTLPMLHLSDPMAAEPSRLIDPMVVWLETEHMSEATVYIPVARPPVGDPAVWEVVKEDGVYKVVATYPLDTMSLMAALPIRLYMLPAMDGLGPEELKAMKPALCRPRLHDTPGIRLFGEDSVLFISLMVGKAENTRPQIVYADGTVCVLDGYDDEKNAWKQVVKERKVKTMKGNLTRPSQINSQPAQVTQVDKKTASPEEKAAVNTQISPANAPLGTVALPSFPPPPQPTEAPAPTVAPTLEAVPLSELEPDFTAEEEAAAKAVEPAPAPAEAPEPKPVKEEPKPKRQPKPVARPSGSLDAISRLTEQLGADISDLAPEQFDDALAEVRALRDLEIAASRRMANLFIAMHKSSQSAIKKYADILSIISAK